MVGNDNRSSSEASGNVVNNYGLTTGQGLAIAALASFALGIGVFNFAHQLGDRDDWASRFDQNQLFWQGQFSSVQQQMERAEKAAELAKTEDRVQINHMMEMEARQKVLIDQVEKLHGNR